MVHLRNHFTVLSSDPVEDDDILPPSSDPAPEAGSDLEPDSPTPCLPALHTLLQPVRKESEPETSPTEPQPQRIYWWNVHGSSVLPMEPLSPVKASARASNNFIFTPRTERVFKTQQAQLKRRKTLELQKATTQTEAEAKHAAEVEREKLAQIALEKEKLLRERFFDKVLDNMSDCKATVHEWVTSLVTATASVEAQAITSSGILSKAKKVVNEQYVLGYSLAGLRGMAPIAFRVFDMFSTTQRQRRQNTAAGLCRKELLCGSAALSLLKGFSQYNNFAQSIHSAYLATTGTPRQHFAVFGALGAALGYTMVILKGVKAAPASERQSLQSQRQMLLHQIVLLTSKIQDTVAEPAETAPLNNSESESGSSDDEDYSDMPGLVPIGGRCYRRKRHPKHKKKTDKSKAEKKKIKICKKARAPELLTTLSDTCGTTSRAITATGLFAVVYDNINMMVQPIIEKYPGRSAGKPIPSAKAQTSEENYQFSLDDSTGANPYAPFKSKMDWEIAKWVKLRGSGSTAFTDLLQVEGVRESLDLSYGTSAQLNKIIDEKLPGRPKFTRSEVAVNGEVFYLYSRDILESVCALWGDTDFAPYLFVAPERHYIDKDKTIRMYHNMHTGKWWWSTQEAVEKDNPGATIIPIIISSDKTQLTVFGNKTAYPVYMTIGNIPKEIRRKPSRRGYVLLGYLPTSHMKNDAGTLGIPLTSGDGVTRRGHPIYAEQVLVTAVKTGECPTCEVPHDELGEDSVFPLRDLESILAVLDMLDDGPAIYAQACAEAGIKPIYHPFWEGLPYTNIFQAISPDILHQLYQVGFRIFRVLPARNLGVREDFKLPKLHSCGHYIMYIKLFGTTNNYNTEYTERLHIDLAKDAYRSTNFKDEFPQMTLWLERKEKIYRHEKYIQWRLDGCPSPPVMDDLPPGIVYERKLKMTKHPTLKSVWLTHLVTDYGATFFQDALARYVIHLNYPQLSRPQIEACSQATALSFNTIPVFHRIKFTTQDPYTACEPEDLVVDSIHVQPTKLLKNGEQLPARFDTALVNEGAGGMTGYRVAQVRVIFSLRPSDIQILFLPSIRTPKYLACVEWFTPFTQPEPDHLMYKVTRHLEDGDQLASIIPVTNIRRSVHLLPKFGPVAPPEWKSGTVLDDCKYFFVNSMTDRHIYTTLF
ncbi:hypothetical protein B0H10DRAFT_1946637 [Mycena sp. CBHHK59/15]|nr:hypothetical protein B0H10DRAFT_1946637 [Mycena sp. CBHHK59/15]